MNLLDPYFLYFFGVIYCSESGEKSPKEGLTNLVYYKLMKKYQNDF